MSFEITYKIIIIKLLILYLGCVHMEASTLEGPEASESPGTGATCGCERPDAGAGTQTQVFCK